MEHDSEHQALVRDLEKDLLKEHGPLLSGDALLQALGFQTVDAFRQASSRGQLPVPVFDLKYRRGKYALCKDVAVWLATQRNEAVEAKRLKGKTTK